MLGGDGPMKKAESKPRYPTIRMDLDTIPEAKDWKVSEAGSDKGNEYEITMKVKMIGLSQSRFDSNAEFEVREIEAAGPDDSEEEDAEGKDE